MSTTPAPQMDVLYMKDFGHVLGIFTRNAEPSQMEATADSFVGGGFHLLAPIYTSMSISGVALAAPVATLTVQVQEGDFPAVGDVISVQGLTANPQFNVNAAIVTEVAPGSPGTVSYTTIATSVNASDSGTVVVVDPESAEFVIPASLIAVFRANLDHTALVAPLDYAANSFGSTPPTKVQQPSGGAVTVAVGPGSITITPPPGASGSILVLIGVPGAALAQTLTMPIPTSGVLTPNLLGLDSSTSYRAIVFVPGCPIAVSGMFPG